MIKLIQQTLILALCLLMPSLATAARSVDDAKEVAAEFFQSGDDARLGKADAFILAHTLTDGSSNPICYVFNAKDGKGFVIISADENAMPVVGYSADSAWDSAKMPGAAKQMISSPVVMHADSRSKIAQMRAGEVESKLLTTPSWSQEAPFNNMIPNRRLTGCVGVALAEILKYHGYPANRPASLVKDGESSVYEWSAMRNDNYRSGYSQEEASAVAALVADAAIGIGTDFGMSSSSAYEVKVPYALTSLFGYDACVSYKKRAELSKAAWDQIIVDEINAGRPVLYSGQDVSSGHAFVCDGYELRGGIPYFHINWGWGGSANGYFASDALNPVVSKAHSYNDLMTIVYNIKPATGSAKWSDIHVTSDERQPGLTLNVSDITSADSFSVRVGALKNISNTNFSGKLAVALFDASGAQKGLLSDARNFTLWALQISKYADFSCKVPAGVSVADGDKVGIVSMENGSSEWLPLAGDRLAPAEVSAKNYEVPYLTVTLPGSNNFYTITAPESKAILGRDFVFTLTQLDPSRLITLKANGFILTPDGNGTYRLSNVMENQRVTVNNQIAASVLSKSTLWVTAGNLQNLLSDDECASVKDLTLYGTINASDFNFMRDRMKLERLDISQVSIVAQGSNPANAIPAKAFMSYRSLKQIILPKNLTTFKNACFGLTGLTSVDIPASVSNWEYNVFANCTSLREVTVRRAAPVWINWCVFTNTPQAKLRVPVGASGAYKAKEYWQDFKEIVEGLPSESDEFTVKMAEKKGLKFTKLTDEDYFWKGDPFEFKVETDNSFGDAILQVYCNSTLLYPDANGKYKTTINGNSLIHVEIKQPQTTTPDTTWKLTGDEGGIGLVTDVVNVPVGKTFTVRANAIKVPKGDDAAKFYAMVLTTKDGEIKEFISSIQSNYYSRQAANLTCNFYCQVKESKVGEGNQIRLATSYNKKDWQLVGAEADSIKCSLAAVGNQVAYHSVTMPASVEGARIDGVATEVVRGMPFTVKASAINPAQRVTVGVNGDTKAFKVANANVTIPAVLEDLDITILVQDADAGDYMVYNISEGQLASKLAEECPARLKLVGSMFVKDFDALRANASTIIDLDLSEVTIKGAMMTGNQLPENAFAPLSSSSISSLKTVILPNNLERIDKNALARCTQISEITIPANVNYIGAGAFSSCVNLKKIIAKPKVAPTCGNTSPFPSNPSSISLEVPKGSEESYSVPSTWWAMLSLYKVPVEHKDYYWVKLDRARVGVNSYKGDINKVAVGQKDEVTMTLVLPNSQSKQFKPYDHVRPGVPFKVYDNGIDVFNNTSAYSMTGSGTPITPEQSWSMVGGLMLLRWNPAATSGVSMPQNHNIELNFYYDIKFENKESANGVKAEIVEVPEGSEWKNVPMRYFKYLHDNGWQQNPEVKPVLYKEGSEIKFQLSGIPEKTVPVVTLKTKVMTKTGYSPEYEEREMTLEDNGGIYTIPALVGDCWVSVSCMATFEEGDLIPAEYLENMDKEEAVSFNELAVSGDLTDKEFEQVRENFENLEVIDLTAIENTVLPESAFEGMGQLVDVIVSENVTEIGAGCFKDCSSIESLTLPGVTSIGEGAFEGCESLTSILLPSLGASVASGKPGMRRAGEIEGVNAESFRGLSPNCLIYIGENEIPGSEGLNIILNRNGKRVAASDINLDGNHPFNAPASFMLGDHKISFTVDVTSSLACDVNDGWTTIMLPFQPTSMEIGEKFADRAGSGLHILSFDDEESEVLTEQKEFFPNRPYLANVAAPFSTVPVTFSAGARQQEGDEIVYDVPFTPVPEETVAVGKEFSLYGSYDGQTRPVVCYMLNEEGSTFVRSSETANTQAVKPFSAYLTANYANDKTEVAVGEHPIWVVDPRAAGATGTNQFRSSKIELESLTKRAAIYYTVDGSDPAQADGTRKLYSGPLTMESESMTVKAIAEYKDYVSDPVTLDFELKKSKIDYALEGEWNWISHNVEKPVAVADFATSGIDGILSQTQEVIFDSKHGMIGSLTHLLPTQGYKVRLSGDSWNGSVAGVSFDPVTTVKLNKGWNWIGTPVDEGSLLIEDLLADIEAEEGDMLVGLDGFVQADAEGAWKGTVTHMVPGVGYMFYSNSDKEFVYNLVAAYDTDAPAKAPVVAIDGHWSVDNHKYASVMPVIASLEGVGASEDYQVAAFCGDECRGIGVMVDGLVMINVHGNAGDVISFRFIGLGNEEMLSATSVAFEENPKGTFAHPFAIAAVDATAVSEISAGSFGIVYENGNFILNGDLSDVKSVEIYDLTGKMIARSTGDRTLNVGNIDGSVVTVVVRKADSTSTVKVIVK